MAPRRQKKGKVKQPLDIMSKEKAIEEKAGSNDTPNERRMEHDSEAEGKTDGSVQPSGSVLEDSTESQKSVQHALHAGKVNEAKRQTPAAVVPGSIVRTEAALDKVEHDLHKPRDEAIFYNPGGLTRQQVALKKKMRSTAATTLAIEAQTKMTSVDTPDLQQETQIDPRSSLDAVKVELSEIEAKNKTSLIEQQRADLDRNRDALKYVQAHSDHPEQSMIPAMEYHIAKQELALRELDMENKAEGSQEPDPAKDGSTFEVSLTTDADPVTIDRTSETGMKDTSEAKNDLIEPSVSSSPTAPDPAVPEAQGPPVKLDAQVTSIEVIPDQSSAEVATDDDDASTNELAEIRRELHKTQIYLRNATTELSSMTKQKKEWQERAFSLWQQAHHHLQPLQSMMNSAIDIEKKLQDSPTFVARFNAGEVDGRKYEVPLPVAAGTEQ